MQGSGAGCAHSGDPRFTQRLTVTEGWGLVAVSGAQHGKDAHGKDVARCPQSGVWNGCGGLGEGEWRPQVYPYRMGTCGPGFQPKVALFWPQELRGWEFVSISRFVRTFYVPVSLCGVLSGSQVLEPRKQVYPTHDFWRVGKHSSRAFLVR